jgi:hypothetical protein
MTTVSASFLKAGEISAPIFSQGGVLLYAKGLDANNTVKTQRSTDGITWVDITVYSSDQTGTAISESTINAQHRLVCVSKQAVSVNGAAIRFKLSKETTNVALLAPA